MTLAPDLRRPVPAGPQLLPTVHAAPRRARGPRAWRAAGGLLQLAVLAGGFHLALALRPNASAELVATAVVLLVPGGVVLRALGLAPRGASAWVYTVGASLTVLMLVALTVNQLGPAHGLPHPLASGPLTVALDATVALLAVVATARRNVAPWSLPRRVSPNVALLLVPVVVAGGTQLLENTGASWLVALGLAGAGAAVLWGFIAARAGHETSVHVVLYVVALALMWSFSLRSKGLYGFDVQQEFAAFRTTADALRWSPLAGDPYSAMLSITALPTALWQLTGLGPMVVFKVVLPVVFALYPVAVYAGARRWVRSPSAYVATCLVFLTASMASQMPALARQEVALLLFAGALLVAFDPALPRRGAQVLLLLLGTGMVVSHYSTTYIALAALMGARVVALALRVLRRGSARPVLSLPVVLALVALCAIWTGPVTSSASNVTSFADNLSSNGVQVLPNKGDGLLNQWLAGNVTRASTPRDYFDSVDSAYQTKYPWLDDHTFTTSVQAHFPSLASSAPGLRPWQPGLAAPLQVVTTQLRQVVNLAIALGSLATLLLLRRRRIDSDVAALVLAMFAVTALVRLSGSAAFSYNPERLAIQTGALLVVPLALVMQSARRQLAKLAPDSGRRFGLRTDTPQRLATVVALVLVSLTFLDSSGLGARAAGKASGNLAATGEYAERFHATSQDLAASQWIAGHRRKDSIIFADRYGALLVQFGEGRQHQGVFPDLTPGTLDTRGLVFASTSNILVGRARGITPDNQVSSTYQFPTTFLDTFKAVVFDTGAARVYS